MFIISRFGLIARNGSLGFILYHFIFSIIRDIAYSVAYTSLQPIQLFTLGIYCSSDCSIKFKVASLSFLVIKLIVYCVLFMAKKPFFRALLFYFLLYDIMHAFTQLIDNYFSFGEPQLLFYSQSFLNVLGGCFFQNNDFIVYVLALFSMLFLFFKRIILIPKYFHFN